MESARHSAMMTERKHPQLIWRELIQEILRIADIIYTPKDIDGVKHSRNLAYGMAAFGLATLFFLVRWSDPIDGLSMAALLCIGVSVPMFIGLGSIVDVLIIHGRNVEVHYKALAMMPITLVALNVSYVLLGLGFLFALYRASSLVGLVFTVSSGCALWVYLKLWFRFDHLVKTGSQSDQ